MKKILALYILVAIISCTPAQNFREGQIVKTKQYVGKYVASTKIKKNLIRVQTEKFYLWVKTDTIIAQPGDLCYYGKENCALPGTSTFGHYYLYINNRTEERKYLIE